MKQLQTKNPGNTKALVVVKPSISEDFNQARQHHQMAKFRFAESTCHMVMEGVELKRLKAKYGIKRGGDRRSDQTQNNLGLKWEELVQREMGYSDETASNRIRMADAAGERIPLIARFLNGEIGLDADDLHQEKVVSAIRDVIGDRTAQQLMWDWNLSPRPALRGGGPGGTSGRGTRTPAPEEIMASYNDITQFQPIPRPRRRKPISPMLMRFDCPPLRFMFSIEAQKGNYVQGNFGGWRTESKRGQSGSEKD